MTLMNVIVRRACKSDIEALCPLIHAFHEFHAAGLPLHLASLGELKSFDTTELVERLLEILGNAEAAIFVAESDGRLMGFAEVYFRQDGANTAVIGHKYGYLQSLMVSEKVRAMGIGKQLLQQAEKWAQGKGAEEMRLEIWDFEQGPLKFYEKLAYKTLKRTLVRELE